MKLSILEGLPPRQHATPSKSLFSEDVEPPISARRGGGGAATRRARNPLLTRCIALVDMALRQSPCVPRAQQSAGCFTSIRGRTGALSVGKIIESRPCTLSGNGQAAYRSLARVLARGCTIGVCVTRRVARSAPPPGSRPTACSTTILHVKCFKKN